MNSWYSIFSFSLLKKVKFWGVLTDFSIKMPQWKVFVVICIIIRTGNIDCNSYILSARCRAKIELHSPKSMKAYARMNTYKFFEVFMLNNWICRTKQDYATFWYEHIAISCYWMLNMLILQSAKLGSKWKEEKAKFRQIADNQAKMFSKGQRLNYRPFNT